MIRIVFVIVITAFYIFRLNLKKDLNFNKL